MSTETWTVTATAGDHDQWNLYDDSETGGGKWLGTINGKDNANKASAAPDLYAALLAITGPIITEAEWDEVRRNAHNAIAKAEGNS